MGQRGNISDFEVKKFSIFLFLALTVFWFKILKENICDILDVDWFSFHHLFIGKPNNLILHPTLLNKEEYEANPFGKVKAVDK